MKKKTSVGVLAIVLLFVGSTVYFSRQENTSPEAIPMRGIASLKKAKGKHSRKVRKTRRRSVSTAEKKGVPIKVDEQFRKALSGFYCLPKSELPGLKDSGTLLKYFNDPNAKRSCVRFFRARWQQAESTLCKNIVDRVVPVSELDKQREAMIECIIPFIFELFDTGSE